jgi:hypothetical protein
LNEIEDITRRLRIIEEELGYIIGEEEIEDFDQAAYLLQEAFNDITSAQAKLFKFLEIARKETESKR